MVVEGLGDRGCCIDTGSIDCSSPYASLISYLLYLSKQDGKFAMGFSGDIEGGGKTAYDVLPPKPWKAAP